MLANLYEQSGLYNPAVIVDTNHANSGKKWDQQVRIAKEILHSTRHNEKIRKMVKGLMIESYIEDGCQKVEEGVYGKSITDPCLGWEKTEKLIFEIADKINNLNEFKRMISEIQVENSIQESTQKFMDEIVTKIEILNKLRKEEQKLKSDKNKLTWLIIGTVIAILIIVTNLI